MRKELERIIKKVMRRRLLQTRLRLNLTQERMAERLHMSYTAYSNIERGIKGCGLATIFFYLIYYCDDPRQFICEIKDAWEGSYAKL